MSSRLADGPMPELSYQLKDSGAKLLLAHPSTAALALEVAQSVGLPTHSVFVFVNPGDRVNPQTEGLRPWTDFWASRQEVATWHWHRITAIEEAKRTTAIINYSSG